MIRFRPTEAEERLIEWIRERHRFKSRTEAIHYLLQQVADEEETVRKKTLEPLLSFRVPPEYRWKKKTSITSKEIDEVVYGDTF